MARVVGYVQDNDLPVIVWKDPATALVVHRSDIRRTELLSISGSLALIKSVDKDGYEWVPISDLVEIRS